MNLNHNHHPPANICENEEVQLQTNDEVNEEYQSNTTVTAAEKKIEKP